MKFRVIAIAMLALLSILRGHAAQTNTAAAAGGPPASTNHAFEVRGFRIIGDTVLPPEDFLFLTNYIGPAMDVTRLRQGLGELQLHYRNLGFATISVTLPQQRLTNGIVNVKIVEGKLSRVVVQGNRYYSSNNVMRALPSLATNKLINTKWLQPDLDRANANPDRQIYPAISPGLEPGTTELTLKVKDRLPLHGHIEFNDKATPMTPLLRIDTAIQYNNLWQLNHQVGLEYNFSPQDMKTEDQEPRFYNQPLVASYSGFYRIPLGFQDNLRERYDQMPVDFGYNQVTHRFELPQSTGNPEWIIFASGSSSGSFPSVSPVNTLTNTAQVDISTNTGIDSLSTSTDVGTKFVIPTRDFAGISSSVSLGIDYKTFYSHVVNTLYSHFALYSLDPFGNRVLVTNVTIALSSTTNTSVDYLPLSFGWTASRPDPWGSTSFSFNQNIFLSGLASARTGFQILAGSMDAGGNYTTITPGLVRELKLPDDWSLLYRASGQWASAPLISNEQYELGGSGGVRGYREGEAYGDSGWKTQCDLRAPPIKVGAFPTGSEEVPAYLRCSLFMDYGQVYHRAQLTGPTVREWGTGVGFYLTAGQHFDARLTLAWALNDTPLTTAGTAFGYFSIGLQF